MGFRMVGVGPRGVALHSFDNAPFGRCQAWAFEVSLLAKTAARRKGGVGDLGLGTLCSPSARAELPDHASEFRGRANGHDL